MRTRMVALTAIAAGVMAAGQASGESRATLEFRGYVPVSCGGDIVGEMVDGDTARILLSQSCNVTHAVTIEFDPGALDGADRTVRLSLDGRPVDISAGAVQIRQPHFVRQVRVVEVTLDGADAAEMRTLMSAVSIGVQPT